MGSNGLPDWMKFEQRREPPRRRETARIAVAILLMLTGALIGLSVYVRAEYPSGFHLPVIAANAVFLVAVGLSHVHFSAKSGGAFIMLAVPINILTLAGATGDGGTSALIAFMSTLLCTGLTGLILLSRTDKPLSRAMKISVTGFLFEMTILGPVLYLVGLATGLFEGVASVFLIVSIPMMILFLTAFLIFSAYHWSETTLPSDGWV